jgi:hypothetical protein
VDSTSAANTFELALLQNAQEGNLSLCWKFSDFVEEVCDTENFSIDQSWLFQEPASSEPENPQDLAQELAARERDD